MTVVQWKFETLDGLQSYLLEINPNATTTPVRTRPITWTATRAGFTGTKEKKAPVPWEFSGVLRSQAQYDTFVTWVTKDEKVRVTTHLGQVYVLRFNGFKPVSGGRAAAPFRHLYSIAALVD